MLCFPYTRWRDIFALPNFYLIVCLLCFIIIVRTVRWTRDFRDSGHFSTLMIRSRTITGTSELEGRFGGRLNSSGSGRSGAIMEAMVSKLAAGELRSKSKEVSRQI